MKRILLTITIVLLIISGCSAKNNDSKEVTLNIMAAASLTEVFNEIGEVYESENSGAKILFNFAGSQALAVQIEEGGQGDIFASANLKYMTELTEKGFIEGSDIFAKNKLIVAVNKKFSHIKALSDLTEDGVMIAAADKSVPVGNYTQQVLMKIEDSGELGDDFRERILKNIVSQELNVKDVMKKVELGEVDAGFVYATDVTLENRDKINIIDIRDDWNVIAEYPVGIIEESSNMEESKKFIDYLKSTEAKEILSKYGFVTQ